VRKSKQLISGVKPSFRSSSKPISLRDLAAYLGLSRTTVSLVLNDSPIAQALTSETRERVLKAAAELHYKANYFARMLNNKRSQMVGILSPDFGEGYDSSILTAIERVLIDRNYLYFVSSHHWDKALIQQRLQVFAERGAEGVILINTPAPAGSTLPLVSIGNLECDFPATRIMVDNAYGIRQALEHLHALGHREIAFLKGHAQSSDAKSRWAACLEAMRGLNLRIHEENVVHLKRIHDGLSPIREGYIACSQLLKASQGFTALLAFNDLSAIGAINALRDAGKRIPEDVSVIGFDDIQAATIIQPTLTTIRQPLTRMGVLAASEILAHIEGPDMEPRNILLKPELVIRQSSAVCPQGASANHERISKVRSTPKTRRATASVRAGRRPARAQET
jgi:DNA-binding LacI/PurR family transcriptional regulator